MGKYIGPLVRNNRKATPPGANEGVTGSGWGLEAQTPTPHTTYTLYSACLQPSCPDRMEIVQEITITSNNNQ